MARLRVEQEAAEQIRAIDRWWRENTGRPRLFAEEWKHARQKLRALPLIGNPRPKRPGQRRLLLPGCKHYIYYLYEPPPLDEVVILEVRSTYRDDSAP